MCFIKMPEDKRCKNSKEVFEDITLNKNVFTLIEKKIFFPVCVKWVRMKKKLLRCGQAVLMVILFVFLYRNIPHSLTKQTVLQEVKISELRGHRDVIKV